MASPVRNCCFVAALALVTGLNSTVRAQFEAATIKPHNRNIPGFGVSIKGRVLTGVNVSVSSLMAFAYTLHPSQIIDGPGWIESEGYDVVAEAAEGDGCSMKLLARGLVADKRSDPNGKGTFGIHALGSMEVRDATMADFAGWLQRYVVDRPVVDHTGVAGRYSFTLNWKADEFQFATIAPSLPVEPANNELGDLYSTLEQQLGLKLKSTRALIEAVAVDRVERPTAN